MSGIIVHPLEYMNINTLQSRAHITGFADIKAIFNKFKMSKLPFKSLSGAISIPLLLIAVLGLVSPAGAEQMDRSRSRMNDSNSLPEDLNLAYPSSNRSRDTDRIDAKVSPIKSKSSSRSKDKLNKSTTFVEVGSKEQTHKPKTSSKEKFVLAAKIDPTIPSSRSKSSAGNKAIATSLSSSLRLIRDPDGRVNNFGNPIYVLELYVNGKRQAAFDAVSGTYKSQNRDRNIGANYAPLPDGDYGVSKTFIRSNIPEIGGTFISIFPSFPTNRRDLGIHLDPSFNKNGYDGTAGCIGLTTSEDRDEINKFVAKYHPRNLSVEISSSD